FGGPSANYSLSLALHDTASGASGALTFRGNLSGLIGPDDSVNLTNTFLGPKTQTLTLGGNLYTVTIGPFVSPTWIGDQGEGSLSASIAVQSAAKATPEPSSLMLACLGLPSLGLARWLRRRKGVDPTT
ncbi:MAG TPA: PEP-CTERM sorting domain-containing protein, partial [Gemmataceae bacterium]